MIRSLEGAIALVESGGDRAQIRFCNEAFGSVFGTRDEDLFGHDWRELFDSRADGEVIGFIEQIMAGEHSATVVCPGSTRGPERVYLKLRPLEREAGQGVLWLWHQPPGFAESQSEGSALESETLRVIFRSTLDPIVTTNAMGQVLAASDSIERVLGWKPEDLTGRNVNVLMPDPLRSDHDAHMRRYRMTGEISILGKTREMRAWHREGHEVPIELSVSRIDVPSRDETLFVGVIHDITERLEAENELREYREELETLVEDRTAELEASHAQLRQADRLASIGTLAAGLGHDMGNILLPIRCRLESLAASGLTMQAIGHVEALRQSVNYLQQLADGLHMLALDPNDREASEHFTELSEWWNHVGLLLTKSLPRDVRLAVSVPSDLPPVAVAPHRLTQAVLNLLINAAEAVGQGGSIRIVAERADDASMVILAVRDNGSGMSTEVMEQALDPFFTTKKRGLGTGLGLTLVQGIVRSVGGAVHIESTLGQGTTVTLTMPLATACGASATDEAGTLDLGRACISIEDPRIAALVTAMLSESGFDVHPRTDNCPDVCVLWVTDAHLTDETAVRRTKEHENREVIVLNGAAPKWRDAGARVVGDPDHFEELRTSIGDAVASLKGGMTQ